MPAEICAVPRVQCGRRKAGKEKLLAPSGSPKAGGKLQLSQVPSSRRVTGIQAPALHRKAKDARRPGGIGSETHSIVHRAHHNFQSKADVMGRLSADPNYSALRSNPHLKYQLIAMAHERGAHLMHRCVGAGGAHSQRSDCHPYQGRESGIPHRQSCTGTRGTSGNVPPCTSRSSQTWATRACAGQPQAPRGSQHLPSHSVPHQRRPRSEGTSPPPSTFPPKPLLAPFVPLERGVQGEVWRAHMQRGARCARGRYMHAGTP